MFSDTGRLLAALPRAPEGRLWQLHRVTAWRMIKDTRRRAGIVGPMSCPHWLKNTVPPPHGDTCCVSGVMHAPAASTAGRGQSPNPASQAAPGDTNCCPNNMLVCPTPRRFCPR